MNHLIVEVEETEFPFANNPPLIIEREKKEISQIIYFNKLRYFFIGRTHPVHHYQLANLRNGND